ncbi:dTDP-4-dehydrorhamnose reductase [Jannaschia aquimarina]|uniref:dTDP-4-dehydrorhamnose reductase n=1 Tax=Jannaschia aquimarina TaxID=935700 RepID=A0A0D1ECU5_9RHOB|nr:dTDP-4-dehydrorhamnose reductase [Jannaschia aquimarina]KIT15549.1 dTDP-4-dehydrorhamnose reductase [Jannaschia aquimarina]SNT26790.1 dTDP-4-dehydrorhamnose reductase [Jannaschia aquimarina]
MILVVGQSGQVAQEAGRIDSVSLAGRATMDLNDPDGCAAHLHAVRPDAVVNAAAFTAVDRAEDAEAEAYRVNAEAPEAMARACAAMGIPFVQISTDYVFDGSGDAPRQPDAATGPLNAYGRSKLAGEEGVRAAGGPHVILRTSWVFGPTGANFVRSMLRLGADRRVLGVVDDQIGGPTPARDLAAASVAIARHLLLDPGTTGTYHFAGTPDVSWAGFAREIFAQAGLECRVDPIPTTAFPTPAKRPLNSRLDCTSTETAFGLPRPDWRAGLRTVLAQIGETT